MRFFSKISIPLLAVLCVLLPTRADDKPSAEDQANVKKALQELSEFVGEWKANGESKAGGKNNIWKEKIGWSWKFNKEGDSWIAFNVEDAKYYQTGELRYVLKDKKYQFKTKVKDGKEEIYTGSIVKQRLVLERTDDKSKDVHKITMNTAAEGVRFLLAYEVQTGGKGLATNVYKLSANKEGESLAGNGGKKNECIVTGGLGTISVSFNGKTYYVCCSGCRDEFNDNPQKYIDAAEKKKK